MVLVIGSVVAYLFLPFPWWIVVVVGLIAFEGLEVWFWLWMRRQRPRSGHETLVGERGVLASPDRVRIRGTTYPARVRDAEPGDPVVVEGLEGMTLLVRGAEEQRGW